jgi:hypothetical protein
MENELQEMFIKLSEAMDELQSYQPTSLESLMMLQVLHGLQRRVLGSLHRCKLRSIRQASLKMSPTELLCVYKSLILEHPGSLLLSLVIKFDKLRADLIPFVRL